MSFGDEKMDAAPRPEWVIEGGTIADPAIAKQFVQNVLDGYQDYCRKVEIASRPPGLDPYTGREWAAEWPAMTEQECREYERREREKALAMSPHTPQGRAARAALAKEQANKAQAVTEGLAQLRRDGIDHWEG